MSEISTNLLIKNETEEANIISTGDENCSLKFQNVLKEIKIMMGKWKNQSVKEKLSNEVVELKKIRNGRKKLKDKD